MLSIIGTLPFPDIDPEIFRIGPFALRWYSLAYMAGIFIGWWYLARMGTAAESPHKKSDADDFILWATAGIIGGGRLGYVLFYNLPFYLENPLSILKLWDGGMSFHGGLLGTILAIVLFARKRNIHLRAFADRIACIVPIGLFFGRIANFINGELWGRVTDAPWAMVFPTGGPEPRHPSQLYEAALEGVLLFIILNLLLYKTGARRYPGLIVGTFFVGYGLSRYLIEFVREPDAHLGLLANVISMGQLLSLPMVLYGLYLILTAIKAGPTKFKKAR